MKPVESIVEIDRPAAEVFAFLEDVANNPLWLKGMRSCRWTSAPPVAVGSTYDQKAAFLGREITTRFKVVGHEPGRLVTIASMAGSSFPITVSRRVERRGSRSCRVVERMESDPTGFYRLATPLLRLMVQTRIRRDYRGLKRLLESRAVAEGMPAI